MNPTALTTLALACCPFLGAGAVLAFDTPPTPPPAVVAQAPADEPVPPLLVQEPTVETTTSPTSERRAATTRSQAEPQVTAGNPGAPRIKPLTSDAAPTATATPTPRPTATATPEPAEPAPADPEPGPVWTAADQAAADARCEARLPGSRAGGTPGIGEPYDPDLNYPCSGNI